MPRLPQCPVVGLVVQKGGVAKTSTTLALGMALARAGRRILLVDLDYQRNLTRLTVEGEVEPQRSVGGLLLYAIHGQGVDASGAVFHDCHADVAESLRGVDVLAGDPTALYMAAGQLREIEKTDPRRADGFLRQVLDPLRGEYDYIFVDNPPVLFDPTVSSTLAAATHVLIPCTAEGLAVEGVGPLLGRLEAYQRDGGPAKVLGIVVQRYRENLVAQRDAFEALRQFPVPVFDTVIHESTAVNEAHNANSPILGPKRRGIRVRRRASDRPSIQEEYEALAVEFEKRIGAQQ